MDFEDFIAGKDDNDRKIDRVLKSIFKENKSVNVFEILRKNLVKINGSKARKNQVVKTNDKISVPSFLLENRIPLSDFKSDSAAEREKYKLETLFKNKNLWIINKPSGINVQPSEKSSQSISNIVLLQWKNSPESRNSLSFTPAPLHRLDKLTSGVLSISQSLDGARWFSQEMKNHSISKKYLGVIQGILKEKVHWTDKISKNNYTENFYTVHKSTILDKNENSMSSSTYATPLFYGKWKGISFTLAEFNIETGRKHQIRLHSSANGFPFLGDTAYGGIKGPFFLHAASLVFPENNLGVPEKVNAPLPEAFYDFLKINLLNWNGEIII